MKLQELITPERVYTPEAEPKERLEYSVDAVWKFKRKSFSHCTVDMCRAGISCVLEREAMQPYLDLCAGSARAAKVLFDENQRLLANGKTPISIDSDEAKAYAHYIVQTLQKSHFAKPRWDDWGQTFYKSNNGRSDLMPGVDIPRALTGLVTNYEESQKLFIGKDGERKQEIQEILAKGNLVVISNHCTWLNLPLIVSFLHREVGIPLSNINTLLGPALTTYQQGLDVAGIGNLIKTIPDTPNGRLDNVAPELQKKVRNASIREIMRRMKGEGQVLVMSPGGTTDRVTEEAIELLEASQVTQRLVKGLSEKHAVWPIATHTGALYAGHKIRAGRFKFYEDGIWSPDKEVNPIRGLKHHMRALNPDREVNVLDEARYTGEA